MTHVQVETFNAGHGARALRVGCLRARHGALADLARLGVGHGQVPAALGRALVVRAHVTGDHVAAACGVRALGAAVRLLARVSPFVRVEVVAAREHLPTVRALVRLESGVESHVSSQHVAARERPVAHLAVVDLVVVGSTHGLCGQVLSHVLGQIVIRWKCLATDRTQIGHVRLGQRSFFKI